MAGRFYTDPEIAKRIVEWAGVAHQTVLEPSAGDGSFVRAMPCNASSVTAIEIVPELFEPLSKIELPRNRAKPTPVEVIRADYLEWDPAEVFDVAIANPPYEEGADVRHIAKMIDDARRVVVLVRANLIYLKSFHEKVLSKAHVTRRAGFLGRGIEFHGPDSKGYRPRHDYEVIELKRSAYDADLHRMISQEWWW